MKKRQLIALVCALATCLPIMSISIVNTILKPAAWLLRKTGQLTYSHPQKACVLTLIAAAYVWENKKDEILMFAAQQGWHPLYRWTSFFGAHINPQSTHARLALEASILHSDEHLVQDLLEHGVDANAVYRQGTTALMLAIEHSTNKIVDLILDHGADSNARNNVGQTALMIAANKNLLDISQNLIDHGADRTIEDNEHRTALHYAQEASQRIPKKRSHTINQQLQELVRPHSIKDKLRQAIKQHNQQIVEQLIHKLDSKISLPYEDENCTPLMDAAQYGTFEIFYRIFQEYDDYTYKNKKGQNVLLLPIYDEHIFETLLSLPFLDSRDNDGVTVLMNAIRLHSNNKTLIEKILSKNVDVNAQDKDGKTALMMAAQSNNDQLVELLIKSGARKDVQDAEHHTAYYFAHQAGKTIPYWNWSGAREGNRHIQQMLLM